MKSPNSLGAHGAREQVQVQEAQDPGVEGRRDGRDPGGLELGADVEELGDRRGRRQLLVGEDLEVVDERVVAMDARHDAHGVSGDRGRREDLGDDGLLEGGLLVEGIDWRERAGMGVHERRQPGRRGLHDVPGGGVDSRREHGLPVGRARVVVLVHARRRIGRLVDVHEGAERLDLARRDPPREQVEGLGRVGRAPRPGRVEPASGSRRIRGPRPPTARTEPATGKAGLSCDIPPPA